MQIEDNARWLRVREAARTLSVSEATVRSWLSCGKLEGFKVGGVVRVDRESLEKMARAHRYADVRRAAQQRHAPSRWRRLRGRAGY